MQAFSLFVNNVVLTISSIYNFFSRDIYIALRKILNISLNILHVERKSKMVVLILLRNISRIVLQK